MFLKSALLLATVAVVYSHHGDSVSSGQQVLVKKLYDSVVTPEYNANVRPAGVNGTDATFITVGLKDIKVVNVDQEKGTFTFQAYAIKKWIDSRLAYNDSTVSYLPVRECKGLWTPDLFFVEALETGEFPPNYHNKARVGRIYPDGKVLYSFRLTATIHCPYIFKPDMKEFICPVKVQSYGYFDEEVQVYFKKDAVTTMKDVFVPKFTFGGVTTPPKCEVNKERNTVDHDHVHSCIQFDFKFTRA